MLKLFAPLVDGGTLRLRHSAHFAVGRGIGDNAVEVSQLGLGGAIGLDCLDHRTKFGMLAGQFHIGIAGDPAGELAFDHRLAVEQSAEFLVRQHDV
jgi:hypothetical protein